jgi:hypothetical protein
MRVKVISNLPDVRHDPKGLQNAINKALKALDGFYITEVKINSSNTIAYIFYTPRSRNREEEEE